MLHCEGSSTRSARNLPTILDSSRMTNLPGGEPRHSVTDPTCHSVTQQVTALHNMSQRYTTSHSVSQQVTALHNKSQRYTTCHSVTQQVTAFHKKSQRHTTSHSATQGMRSARHIEIRIMRVRGYAIYIYMYTCAA
eukprot:2776221-Pyramimonas_sp.AAC.3